MGGLYRARPKVKDNRVAPPIGILSHRLRKWPRRRMRGRQSALWQGEPEEMSDAEAFLPPAPSRLTETHRRHGIAPTGRARKTTAYYARLRPAPLRQGNGRALAKGIVRNSKFRQHATYVHPCAKAGQTPLEARQDLTATAAQSASVARSER
jgi:hypothetical protein